MAMNPVLRWSLRAAVIPAVIIGYVAVAGLTGFCPNCKAVVDSVLGRHGALERPVGAAESIAGVTGYSLDGGRVDLASHTGKPMIIEVWATWCPPCRRQRGIMHEIVPELKDKATFVAMSVDDSAGVVTAFLKDHPSDMIELMASPEAQLAFGGVKAVPTLVFVDAAGKIRGVEEGVHSASLLRDRVAELATASR